VRTLTLSLSLALGALVVPSTVVPAHSLRSGLAPRSCDHGDTGCGHVAYHAGLTHPATVPHPELARHRRARHHALARLHARRVHARALRGSWGLRQAGGGHDWRTWYRTDTRDWWCIRRNEEGNAKAPRNEFGFVPYWPMTHVAQSRLALSILHRVGWSAWSTARGCGL